MTTPASRVTAEKSASRATCTCADIAGENPDCAIHGIAAVISDLRQRSDGASHSAADWLEQYADDRRHSLRSLSDSVSDGSKGVGERAHVDSLWQRKIDDMSRDHGILESQYRELQQRYQAVDTKLQEAVEALKNYADPSGYADGDGNIADPDDGALARITLATVDSGALDELDEIADGAWGDNPMIRGKARYQAARLRALDSGTGGQQPVAYVADYRKSDGTTDYFVMLGCDGREMSLHMHRIRGRAEYEAAEINHIISGSPKPEFDDFDVDAPTEPKAGVVSEDMIERAAKRICLATGLDWDSIDDSAPNDHSNDSGEETKGWFRYLATAALNGDKP